MDVVAGDIELRYSANSAAREIVVALFFTHAAPDAIGLANPEGVITALSEDGAAQADLLGGLDSAFSRSSSLPLGVKKEVGVFGAATSVVLPFPVDRLWAG